MRPIIVLLLSPSLPFKPTHAAIGSQKQQIRATSREKAIGDDACDVIEFRLQLKRIQYLQSVHIENDVAVVGDESFPQDGLPAEPHDLPGHVTPGHRNDLDRKREFTKYPDELAFVSDANEFPRHCRNDLLARQRPSAALDHIQMFGNFIGAIYINRDVVHTVQIHDLDSISHQSSRSRFRACHRSLDFMFDCGEFIYEIVGGGARSYADHASGWNILNGSVGSRLFIFILWHLFSWGR